MGRRAERQRDQNKSRRTTNHRHPHGAQIRTSGSQGVTHGDDAPARLPKTARPPPQQDSHTATRGKTGKKKKKGARQKRTCRLEPPGPLSDAPRPAPPRPAAGAGANPSHRQPETGVRRRCVRAAGHSRHTQGRRGVYVLRLCRDARPYARALTPGGRGGGGGRETPRPPAAPRAAEGRGGTMREVATGSGVGWLTGGGGGGGGGRGYATVTRRVPENVHTADNRPRQFALGGPFRLGGGPPSNRGRARGAWLKMGK